MLYRAAGQIGSTFSSCRDRLLPEEYIVMVHDRKSKLTLRHERFLDEYMIDLNATQAAIRAGYKARSAGVTGCRLLKNANVRAALNRKMAARARRLRIKQEEILTSLSEIAFADERPVLRGDAGEKAGAGKRRGRGGPDKLRALELLCGHLGIDR